MKIHLSSITKRREYNYSTDKITYTMVPSTGFEIHLLPLTFINRDWVDHFEHPRKLHHFNIRIFWLFWTLEIDCI